MSNVTPQPLVETTERYLMVASSHGISLRWFISEKQIN